MDDSFLMVTEKDRDRPMLAATIPLYSGQLEQYGSKEVHSSDLKSSFSEC